MDMDGTLSASRINRKAFSPTEKADNANLVSLNSLDVLDPRPATRPGILPNLFCIVS